MMSSEWKYYLFFMYFANHHLFVGYKTHIIMGGLVLITAAMFSFLRLMGQSSMLS
jgi:hypothetical protein